MDREAFASRRDGGARRKKRLRSKNAAGTFAKQKRKERKKISGFDTMNRIYRIAQRREGSYADKDLIGGLELNGENQGSR